LEVGIVKAGEVGGFLDEALARVARFRERDEDLRSRIRSAMAYPILLALLGTGATVYLMVFFIPRFTEIFRNMKEALPWPTELLITVSNALRDHGLLILAALVVVGFLLARSLATDAGQLQRDRLFLRIPALGAMMRKSALARFARVLGTLLRSGVPILEALAIVRGAVGNKVVAAAILTAQDGVREGRPLADPLAKSGEFPATLTDMIEVGEEAGNLEEVLLDAAESYDKDVDRAVKTFVSLLEPAMLLLMGALVGFIVIAMLLPIFTMNSSL
jgi:type II secretory pathway component PulF